MCKMWDLTHHWLTSPLNWPTALMWLEQHNDSGAKVKRGINIGIDFFLNFCFVDISIQIEGCKYTSYHNIKPFNCLETKANIRRN